MPPNMSYILFTTHNMACYVYKRSLGITQFFREISKGPRADSVKKNVAVLYYAGIKDRCKFNIF
ncbi:unnamed protein product, partial [Sphagnum troendelagicum]